MKARLSLLLVILFWSAGWPARSLEASSPADVERALARAGANRAEMARAWRDTPADQRAGMAFLLANMPEVDLQTLKADFLLENVALAYQARDRMPWGKQVPEDIFLNDVLPYANVDEPRHPWRKEFMELCLPLVKDCRTPSEAAHRLNSTIFGKLKVRYSTQRQRPNQSPKETIAQGVATCTGLSILLSDACRSVGVPARLAGTPLWANKRGNHTWVEIWDGRWHFAGAAEPDPKGLDHAWFESDAARANKDSRLMAIYAASFRKTGVVFPMVWAPRRTDVSAVNVTGHYARPKAEPATLSSEQAKRIAESARKFFAASHRERAGLLDAGLDPILAQNESAVRRIVWQAYQEAPIHARMKEDFKANQVRHGNALSVYTVKKVGRRPKNGWPLFIAMHGGGGVPKAVNDQQWKVMQQYYRDQPSVTGYQYLALRAPDDTWNGFYNDNVLPLIENLIRQFLLLGDVDPNKVFIMGYSHGGYGAFFIGPRIPDRFAAIHSSAAAPTDGAISPASLRNTHFTFMIGANDNAYGRRKRCEAFWEEIRKLKNETEFPVVMELKPGFGHTGLPDRDKIKELYPVTRNPVPRHLTWEMMDAVVKRFFWLSVPNPSRGQHIEATLHGDMITIQTRDVKEFELNLDHRVIPAGRPVRLQINGKETVREPGPSLECLCRSLLECGDPELAFGCRVRVQGDRQK
jgi:dienelactone hydrolase